MNVDWLSDAEDYEGVICDGTLRLNTTVLQDGYRLCHVQLHSERV